MYAYTGILAALLQRQKTGLGSHLGVAMLEALAEWISYPLYYVFDGSSPPERSGAAHATIYPYGPFQAGDGHTVMLGLQNEREWLAFCRDVLRQAELAVNPLFDSNAKRHTNRNALRAVVGSRSTRRSARCRRCCHRVSAMPSTTAWTPFPRWANIPRRSCASSALPTPTSHRFIRKPEHDVDPTPGIRR